MILLFEKRYSVGNQMSKEHSPLLQNELREKCGVFGTFSNQENTAETTIFGLSTLQHRGQESSGVASSGDEKTLHMFGGVGLVSHVFDESFDSGMLPGNISIGHNRYGTSSKKSVEHHIQPTLDEDRSFALAHNGNIPDTTALESFLDEHGIANPDDNDSEMMHRSISYYLKKGASLEEAVEKARPLFTGAYSLVMTDGKKLVALRDEKGIRPLSLGRKNGSYVVSSETCAFRPMDIEHMRDVFPGEMVVVDDKGMRSTALVKGEQKLDIFELVYFARPDSNILGKNVLQVRENMGKELAREKKIDADIVIDVPDSGTPAAHGYARESGIPKEIGIIKNRYSAKRTFINPDGTKRKDDVRKKFIPIPEKLKGQRVILVDDSVVRGTTSRELVKMVRDSGAREVHFAIHCPPIRFPDFYGIDTPNQKDLLASQHNSIEEMRLSLSADSLTFLSYEGMIRATGLNEEVFSTSCFTGKYPIDIGKRKSEIVWK